MNWELGYSTSYHACLVDPVTWADGQQFDMISGSVNRTAEGLRGSAEMKCTDYPYASDRWVRIWMDVKQSGASEHVPLFTGLVSMPEQTIEGTLSEVKLQCFSVLKPAQDVYLPIGWYAAKGFKVSEVIANLLKVCPAPALIEEDSPRLAQNVIAEKNETNLSMVESLLEIAGWRMTIDGGGTIHVGPEATDVTKQFGALHGDMLEPKVSRKNDLFDCPNVFRVVSDNESVVAYDDDPDSPFSTAARGREIWKEESSVKLADNESLLQYARRKLKEAQGVGETISYSRSYDPDVNVTDIISLSYPRQNLIGNYIVRSQKISLDHKATTSEEVRTIE